MAEGELPQGLRRAILHSLMTSSGSASTASTRYAFSPWPSPNVFTSTSSASVSARRWQGSFANHRLHDCDDGRSDRRRKERPGLRDRREFELLRMLSQFLVS